MRRVLMSETVRELPASPGLVVGGLYRSPAGNVWELVEVCGFCVRVRLVSSSLPCGGVGTVFVWNRGGMADLERVG